MSASVSICIPLRVTNTFRRLNWLVCAAELAKLKAIQGDIEIIAAEWGGTHATGYPHVHRVQGTEGFNISRARNAAMTRATSDLICFLDSDMIMRTADWVAAIKEARQYDCFSPYRKFKRLGKTKTSNRINADHTFNWDLPINTKTGGKVKQLNGNLAGGIFFCTRKFIESVNGWDERFKKWGYEDIAMCKHAEQGGYKIGWAANQGIHLWHPPEKRGRSETLKVLRTFYTSKKEESNYATHAPVLTDLANRLTSNEIAVEFGAGKYSTPLLAEIAREKGFEFHSYESKNNWRTEADANVQWHALTLEGLDDAIAEVKAMAPSLVFVDTGYLQKGDTCRSRIVKELLPFCKWIVAHDTEVSRSHIYRYDFSDAKYIQHFVVRGVRTTVVSQTDPIGIEGMD